MILLKNAEQPSKNLGELISQRQIPWEKKVAHKKINVKGKGEKCLKKKYLKD
jgi:hypothetical protein